LAATSLTPRFLVAQTACARGASAPAARCHTLRRIQALVRLLGDRISVIRQRMHHARMLLRNQNALGVSEVAAMVGYDDLAGISRNCSGRRHGVSPRAMRRKLAGGLNSAQRGA